MGNPVKVSAKVKKVIKHTDFLSTLILNPLQRIPSFKPGQFLHFSLYSYNPSFPWPESRVFSLASSPNKKSELRITYAVKGQYTKKMFDEIKMNTIVWLKLPYGQFVLKQDATHHILIAGGTGITPFISFLDYAVDNNDNNYYLLYYGIRQSEYLIFHQELDFYSKHLKCYRHTIFCENFMRSDHFVHGIIDIERIIRETWQFPKPVFYISGPVQMIKSFRASLLAHNIMNEQIVIDEWE
jgi:ferredoxin-NADP reductase